MHESETQQYEQSIELPVLTQEELNEARISEAKIAEDMFLRIMKQWDSQE